ncbi:MAG TPA: DJ-1/PfpI family protein [Caulobacteraceae bacterium]|jgi:putative intracellular protease/amidase
MLGRSWLVALAFAGVGFGTAGVNAASAADVPPAAVADPAAPKIIGVVLYPGFEVLDVFGPVEMWGYAPGVKVVTIAEHAGPVLSSQGVLVNADFDFKTAPSLDLMMVPGGKGTFTEVKNPAMLDFLRSEDQHTRLTISVCSGAAILARAGLLKGRRATTNKLYFAQLTSDEPGVTWVKRARWVDDGKYVTSSGVAAGTDMALDVLAKIYGRDQARNLARSVEYEWNEDPDHDPFAIE